MVGVGSRERMRSMIQNKEYKVVAGPTVTLIWDASLPLSPSFLHVTLPFLSQPKKSVIQGIKMLLYKRFLIKRKWGLFHSLLIYSKKTLTAIVKNNHHHLLNTCYLPGKVLGPFFSSSYSAHEIKISLRFYRRGNGNSGRQSSLPQIWNLDEPECKAHTNGWCLQHLSIPTAPSTGVLCLTKPYLTEILTIGWVSRLAEWWPLLEVLAWMEKKKKKCNGHQRAKGSQSENRCRRSPLPNL